MRKQSFLRARPWTFVTATTAAIALVGVAFAAPWTAEADGKAGARAGQLSPVAASEALPSSDLYPGQSADGAVTLTNTNPVGMVVSSIVGNGPVTSSSAACNAAGHGVTFANQSGAWTVGKNQTVTVSLPGAVSMALNSATECQGVTFSIPVRVTSSVAGNGGGSSTTSTTTPSAALAWEQPSSSTQSPGAPYNMGAIAVGSSITSTFNLRNTGQTNLTGVVAAFTPSTSADFTILSNGCANGTLAAGAACPVQVRFAPSSTGTKNATLEGWSSASPQRVTQAIVGTGITPAQLVMTPNSHNFGSLPSTGAATGPVVFTVQNVGQQMTYIDGARLTGAGAQHFDILSSSCGFALNGGQTCQVQVRFQPEFAGSHNASLSVPAVSGAPGGAATAQLSGIGS